MKPHKKPGFRGIGNASGSAIGAIAVKVFSCHGCGFQYRGTKPPQCEHCGRMDFQKLDSIAEARRFGELCLLQKFNKISNLQCQEKHVLFAARPDGAQVKVGEYWSDFSYIRDGVKVIEDVKGPITDLAQWKLRHMAAQGQPVQIVTAKGNFHG